MLLIFEVVRPESGADPKSGADPNGAQDRSLSELVVEFCLLLIFKGNDFLNHDFFDAWHVGTGSYEGFCYAFRGDSCCESPNSCALMFGQSRIHV